MTRLAVLVLAFAAACAAQITSIPTAPGTGSVTAPFTGAFNAGTSDAICALGADASITGITCQASSATSATAFATTVTIPAGTLSANAVPFTFSFGIAAGSTAPGLVITIKLGSTVVFTGANVSVNNVTTSAAISCQLTAPSAASASSPVITSCVGNPYALATSRTTTITPTSPYVAIATNAAQVLSISATFSAATAGNAVWLESINNIFGH